MWLTSRSAYSYLFRTIYEFRWFVIESIRSESKLRYRGSILGILWSVLNPTLQAIVIFFVFREVFKIRILDDKDYFAYVYSGALLINYLLTTLLNSGELIFSKNHLLRSTKITLYPLVVITIISNTINLLFGLIPLSLYMFIVGAGLSVKVLLLPVLLTVMWLWLLLGGVILNMVYSKFLDLKQLMPNIFGLLFYLTPIYYSVEMLSGGLVKFFVSINPLTLFLNWFRYLLGITDIISALNSFIVVTLGLALWPIAACISRDYRERVWAVQ